MRICGTLGGGGGIAKRLGKNGGAFECWADARSLSPCSLRERVGVREEAARAWRALEYPSSQPPPAGEEEQFLPSLEARSTSPHCLRAEPEGLQKSDLFGAPH